PCRGLRFATKSLGDGRHGGEVGQQGFDREIAVEAFVSHAEDDGESTASDHFFDAVSGAECFFEFANEIGESVVDAVEVERAAGRATDGVLGDGSTAGVANRGGHCSVICRSAEAASSGARKVDSIRVLRSWPRERQLAFDTTRNS